MVVIDAVEGRQDRLEARDEMAGQSAVECLRDAEDGVAFGHGLP